MNSGSRSKADLDKGELRRQQVLDAAAACFLKEGFHGSSIARISQAAGMSPGHIYHYFANKEAIVEAIAEREEHDFAELVRRMAQDQDGSDLVTRLTRHTEESVDRNSNPAHIGLMLELAAEGARNPAVASILQRSEQAIAAQFSALVARVGCPEGMDTAEVHRRMEMLATLFCGLGFRAVVAPGRDRKTTVRLINEIVQALMRKQA